VRNRSLPFPDRMAAAESLLRSTRAGSSATREAADAFLMALAACGDANQDEATLHAQLLDELRSNSAMLVRLEQRLLSIPARDDTGDALSQTSLAAIVVAARVDNERLDGALRRALRRNDAIADVIASSLRCGLRLRGATSLLLDCWHDQVAVGKQDDTPQSAAFWFRGQASVSFRQLIDILETSRSAPERVRCLLAMGCVHDDSTLQTLLIGLTSPRRVE